MRVPDTAFFDSYDAVEIRLPNRPVMRCRALTISEAARFLRYMENASEGDEAAATSVFATFPNVVGPRRWRDRKLRRFLKRLRGQEVLDALKLFFPDPPDLGSTPRGESQPDAEHHATFDDLLAEYAVLYGGPPPSTLPYPLFVALAGRGARFEARRILNAMTATNWGMNGAKDGAVASERSRLVGLAYPGGAKKAVMFALKQSENGDG